MGLDVYLIHYKDIEKSQAVEKEYERRSDEIWDSFGKKYDELTDTEKNDLQNKTAVVAKELGLDEYGEDKTYKEDIKEHSKKHSDHMFKIGYFRSSYNEGGINHVLNTMTLPTLYEVFGVTREHESPITVNWEASLVNIKQLLVDFDKKCQRAEGKYRIFDVPVVNMFDPESGVKSEQEALEVFKKELMTTCDFEEYTNHSGHFFKKPLEIYGLIRGFDCLGKPAVYVVTKREGEDDLVWYRQALEIVQETAEYVLSQKDPHNFKLYWSA